MSLQSLQELIRREVALWPRSVRAPVPRQDLVLMAEHGMSCTTRGFAPSVRPYIHPSILNTAATSGLQFGKGSCTPWEHQPAFVTQNRPQRIPQRSQISAGRLLPVTARQGPHLTRPLGSTGQDRAGPRQLPEPSVLSAVPLRVAAPSPCALRSATRGPVTGGSWHSPPVSSLELAPLSLEPAQMLLFSVLKSHQML